MSASIMIRREACTGSFRSRIQRSELEEDELSHSNEVDRPTGDSQFVKCSIDRVRSNAPRWPPFLAFILFRTGEFEIQNLNFSD